MLLQAIFLDASMTVSECRARLAQYGLWLDAHQPDVRAVLVERAQRLSGVGVLVPAGVDLPSVDVADLETSHARDAKHFGVAIRRQWRGRVLWYARSAVQILEGLGDGPGDVRLIDALNLYESDSRPPSDIEQGAPPIETVVMSEGAPVAVNVTEARFLDPAAPTVFAPRVRRTRGPSRGTGLESLTQPPPPPPPESAPATVTAWPRLDAPTAVVPDVTFQVTVAGADSGGGGGGGCVKLSSPCLLYTSPSPRDS